MSINQILLVEDDPDIQENLKLFLELEGFQVHAASNGQEAIHFLQRSSKAQLILLDLMMPIMDGYEFLETYHSKAFVGHTTAPVILISASPELDHVAKKWSVPGLSKPINLELLLESIRNLK